MLAHSGSYVIQIEAQAALDLDKLASTLKISHSEVIIDALRLPNTALEQDLYPREGRLRPDVPIIQAMRFWKTLVGVDATGTVDVGTAHGSRRFQIPPDAFNSPAIGRTLGAPSQAP